MNQHQVEPLVHSPERAAQRLGVSLRAVYTLIAAGELKTFKRGKRRHIPDTECSQYVARQMAEAAK